MDKKIEQMGRIKRYANLIEKQTGKAVRPYRADGYVNLMNRYGTSKDSTERYRYRPEPQVPDELLTMYYESNGLFAKIIDKPAEEAVKHGFLLDGVKDQEIEDFYTEALDELDWEEIAATGIKWARLFGGAIGVMLINDGRGLEEPLDWKHIRSIDDIRIYDRSLIQPDYASMFSYDPRDPFRTRGSRLGMPEYYQVFSKYGNFTVHDSRCLVFQNGILPENTTNSIYQLWGIPEYIRINKAIRDAEVAHGSATKLLDRSIQAVYKMKDLSAELATEEGEERVLRRLQTIDMARGLLNSITIDSEGEDYDFRTFQFAGVSDVVDSTCNYLSALTEIPQTILFGRSPAGMNSTGESDLENWYNSVQRIQKRMLRSNLRYLLSVVFQAGVSTGEIDEVPKIKIEFNPLWSMSEMEQADLELKKAQTQQTKAMTAQTYVDMQAIDPSEVRKKLADSEEFDVENMLDEVADEEELFTGSEAANETNAPGKLVEQGEFADYGQNVSVEEHDRDPGDKGSAPTAAPAATKLPQDMSEEEIEEGEEAKHGDSADYDQFPSYDMWLEEHLKCSDKQAEAAKKHYEAAKGAQKGDSFDKGTHTTPKARTFSAAVLVISEGKILTGIRHNDFGYGLICGPGGHGEAGETPEQTAFRETEEEFGISPKELILLGTGPKEPETGLTPFLYLCTDYDGEPECLDLEMVNPTFLTMEELALREPSLFPPFADSLKLLEQFLTDENCLFPEITLDKSAQSYTIKSRETRDGGKGSGNHGHEGVPGQAGGSAPTGVSEDVTRFETKDGTMKITSDLKVKASKSGKTTATIKAGGEITGVYSFAGKGSDKNLVVSGLVAKQLGGKPSEWAHLCGFSNVVGPDGVERPAEIHWFEHDDIGQVKFKVKKRGGTQ